MMATSSSANAGPVNDDIHKLLLVVKDLAHHLEENRQATTKLKLHADLLKEQLQLYKLGDAGSKGSAPSSPNPNSIDELLAERDELVRENAALRQENQDLAVLVNDYEKGLQTTTELIRDHAYQESLSRTELHQDYNQKLCISQLENERLQQSLIEAEARLIKVSGLLRQAYAVDREADQSVDQALLDLQAQNRGLRLAMGMPVEAHPSVREGDKEVVFTLDEEGRE